MASAVIICAGDFPRREYPRYLLESADLVVCCDSAFSRYLRFCKGNLPESLVIIGDMDSLPAALQKKYAGHIIRIAEQDDNDQTKAVRYILAERPEIDTIHILGATGRREDHTLGNLSLLMEYARTFLAGRTADEPLGPGERIADEPGRRTADEPGGRIADEPGRRTADELGGRIADEPSRRIADEPGGRIADEPLGPGEAPVNREKGQRRDVQVDIVSDYSTAFAITDTCDLYVGEGRPVSVFSPDNSLRIVSEGLQWPTDNVVFDNWWKATLNRATSDRIRLRFSHPSIALVILG